MYLMSKENILSTLFDETTAAQHIGRCQFEVVTGYTWEDIMAHYELIDRVRRNSTLSTAISNKLNNNSSLSWEKLLGTGRPSSSFYSLIDQLLILEWGKVMPETGEAKLHGYLRENIPFGDRIKSGAFVVSGHWGSVSINDRTIAVATLDPLSETNRVVKPNQKIYTIAKTLLSYRIHPFTQDGYPVQFSDVKVS